MDVVKSEAIEALLHESRQFAPAPAFAAQANAQPGIYEEAERDYEAFWKSWADKLEWIEPYQKVLEWNEPFAKWFVGGKLNVSVNCLDRHVKAGLGDRVAFYFEGEPGDRWTITYAQLLADVSRFANGLRKLGVELIYSRRFADHHRFSEGEIAKMFERSKARGARAVITTEKDSVRFPRLGKRPLPVYFLRVEIEIIRGHDAFNRCLERMCRYNEKAVPLTPPEPALAPA